MHPFPRACLRLMLRAALILLPVLGMGQNQAAPPGSLNGKVTDAEDKAPLTGVNVVIKGSNLGASTDLNGSYQINKIPPGIYQIEVTYLGYEKRVYTGIRVEASRATSLSIAPRKSAVTMDQEVVVVGDKPLIDLEQTKTEQRVSLESIEAIS